MALALGKGAAWRNMDKVAGVLANALSGRGDGASGRHGKAKIVSGDTSH
jgi:hypothetical protein